MRINNLLRLLTSISISSSPGLSGSLSKSGCENIKWHVEQVKVPSQAPKPSKSILLFTTRSNSESPIFPLAFILSPSTRTNVISTL